MQSARVFVSFFLSLTLGIPSALPVSEVYAQGQLFLPSPGMRLDLSPVVFPPVLKGLKVHPDHPFRLDFIVDTGDRPVDKIQEKTIQLIKYFLASLTVPEKDLWVNLSPEEPDRIIPDAFGITEMGRDMLAQDYLLKQLTASLMYPENELGKKFWTAVYEKAAKELGTTQIPVDTFQKVWIVPEKAEVWVNNDVAFVVEARLKVMLEEEYLADSQKRVADSQKKDVTVMRVKPDEAISSVLREIILPAIEREVNEGENFAPLREIYHSLILATWFKKALREGILGKMYVEKNKVAGVET
ncbi:MAG: hypothetical protein NUV91_06540, partial [Candidatus Omnitrophica bacterium]|nr:hypothetical protein [Candidatus Omnitrophota bacterium]